MSGKSIRFLGIFASFVMALLCLSGCVRENVTGIGEEKFPTSKNVRITLRYPETKTYHTAEEQRIASLDVYVFDGSTQEAHVRIADATEAEFVNLSLGSKTIYAFCNYPSETMPVEMTLSQAAAVGGAFALNQRNAFLMCGTKTATVAADTETISVEVVRRAAKVSLAAAPVFSGAMAGATLEGIFLINIPKDWSSTATLTGSDSANAWNFGETVLSGPDSAVSALTSATGSSAWQTALYGYPNSSPEAATAEGTDYVTKYVLKVSKDGKIYWYSIGIPGMAANNLYAISNVTINRPGSDSPNAYIAVRYFSVDVLDWSENIDVGNSEF